MFVELLCFAFEKKTDSKEGMQRIYKISLILGNFLTEDTGRVTIGFLSTASALELPGR